MIWQCGSREIDLSREGGIMGILNVTPDSFSDGGEFNRVDSAVAHGLSMLDDGALIIDVGGESTRPGAADVPSDLETSRVLPVIEGIAAAKPDALISIDTSKSTVARKAIRAGAAIVNDVTGLRGDLDMAETVAEFGVGVVIMHMQGRPRTMQRAPEYRDVVAEVREFFEMQFSRAIAAGIPRTAIVFDPGIGFGKTLEHNLELLRNLESLTVQGRPLLLGVSRKSFIGKLIQSDEVEDRNWPTVALTAFGRENGVFLHRVHEVRSNLDALRMCEAILNAKGPDSK
ncbi:MAG: dihydropteroate synthase [Verrucomicrobiales bacterium]|nr:dihydropteroate synthase [Verrucomicrobiales bacterium]